MEFKTLNLTADDLTIISTVLCCVCRDEQAALTQATEFLTDPDPDVNVDNLTQFRNQILNALDKFMKTLTLLDYVNVSLQNLKQPKDTYD